MQTTAQLQVQDTPSTGSINFVVEGKPRPSPQDVAQLARILADAGIEVADRETAPPELWRSLLDAEPILTNSHYDAAKKEYRSTGVREVKVRRALLRQVMQELDLGLLAEEDRELLLDLEATTNGSIVFPPHRAWVARMVVDSFLPTVRECSIVVEGSTVRLTPLQIAGRVRIPKAKLDAIAVDPKSDNPRLARIQAATLHAALEDLLAEARRGAANPKTDGDKDGGRDKREIRCPRPSHADARVSAYVERYPDGVGGGCSGCEGWGGSNYPSLISAFNPRLTWDQACERAEQILGLAPWGALPESQRVRGDEIEALAGLAEQTAELPDPATLPVRKWVDEPAPTQPAPADAPPAPTLASDPTLAEEPEPKEPATEESETKEPPAEEPAPREPTTAPSTSPAPSPPPAASSIAQWLAQQPKVGASEGVWLAGRGLDPTVLARYVFMRAASRSALPTWDGITVGDASFLAEWAEICAKTGHTLLVPTLDESGAVVGVRARRTIGSHPAKTKTPSIQRGRQRHTMPQRGVLASLHAIKALRGEAPWPEWIVIVEGEPDFLTACQLYPAAAVIGIYKGKDAWTQAIASKIPDGSKIALLVDVDGPGRKYRRGVVRSLGKRVRFFDAPGRKHDVNKLLVDGKADTLALDQLKQIPVGEHRELTELGNARRLHDEHGGELAYHAASGRWYVLVDGVWVRQEKEPIEVRRKIQALAEQIKAEAEDAATEEGATRTLVWAQTSQKSSVITATEREARVLFSVGDVFDKDPHLVGVTNGVLDLRTMDLLEEPSAARVSRRVPVAYDPAAACPTFERAIFEIFEGKRDVVACFQRAVGYSLCGDKGRKFMFMCVGEGGDNGKSLLLSTFRKLFGDYGVTVKPRVMFDRSPDAHNHDIADLEGTRIAVISEIKPNARFATDEFKRLVGGTDDIRADRKHCDGREFLITFAFWAAVNRVPRLPPGDAPLGNRILAFPFLRTFKKEEQDVTLKDKFWAERAGILNWVIEGYHAYLRNGTRGIDPPAEVVAHTAAIRAAGDVVQAFLDDVCEVGAGYSVGLDALYRAYKAWHADSGETSWALSKNDFSSDLARRGYATERGPKPAKLSLKLGLRLRAEEPDADPTAADVAAALAGLN